MELDPSIAVHLTDDDDPDLWDVATNTILNEATLLYRDTHEDIYSQVGCCRHWVRPHQSRWLADGSFALPFGYNKTATAFSYSLPDLDWSVFFKWTGDGWKPGRTGERCLLLRIAIPGRTARHMQAAVHTIWTPRSPSSKEKVVRLYGFRKKEGVWRLTATSQPPIQ